MTYTAPDLVRSDTPKQMWQYAKQMWQYGSVERKYRCKSLVGKASVASLRPPPGQSLCLPFRGHKQIDFFCQA